MVPLFVGLQSFAVIMVLLTRLAETPPSKSSLLGFHAQVIPCSPFTCHLIKHCVFVPPHALKPYLVRCFLLDGIHDRFPTSPPLSTKQHYPYRSHFSFSLLFTFLFNLFSLSLPHPPPLLPMAPLLPMVVVTRILHPHGQCGASPTLAPGKY